MRQLHSYCQLVSFIITAIPSAINAVIANQSANSDWSFVAISRVTSRLLIKIVCLSYRNILSAVFLPKTAASLNSSCNSV